MTLLDRLLADREFVRGHRAFLGYEASGPFDELCRVAWREPSGAIAKTPWGPCSLAWAVARTCLELQDEAEAAAGSELARAASFTDEERAAFRKAVA